MNLTDLENEKEEYVLTKEEEDEIIKFQKERVIFHRVWKLKGLGYTDEQITEKVKDIDWSKEIDTTLLLSRANSNKHYDEWQRNQRKKEKEDMIKKQQELKSLYTAKNMFGLMKWRSENIFGKTLIVNDSNKHLITTLCFFISEDERFEKQLGYSFKKGLLIRGISGLGKTFLVQCIEKNELNPILVLSMIQIAEEIKQNGEYEIMMGDNKIIYLDDVGTEEATVNHYGTRINYFKNFIEMVYLRNKTFNKLMISTNNSFSEIEEKYGFRVRSRMKDMFNIIDVTGNDMRGFV